MIGGMGTVHISETELARDLHAILAKVQQGIEVVVEQDSRPVAVLRPLTGSGQPNAAATLQENGDPSCWDRLGLLQFLKESGPGWDLKEHPELNEGAAQWVESLRREDESIDTEASGR